MVTTLTHILMHFKIVQDRYWTHFTSYKPADKTNKENVAYILVYSLCAIILADKVKYPVQSYSHTLTHTFWNEIFSRQSKPYNLFLAKLLVHRPLIVMYGVT